ncbi:hypothetical protein CASFOL_002019 [Castilleja foliolosa]|uniref:Pectinesterase inhibitor domain-containing protein n=1 Tax=Castilleja foliolosa TaxID=1961234 RepID=A0ABD3EDE5_9LAMI
MSRLNTTLKLSLIIFFSFLLYAPPIFSTTINEWCNVTLYKSLCFESLSPYAWYINKNPTQRQVCKLALALSLKHTKYTHKLVTQNVNSLAKSSSKNTSEYLGECSTLVANSVDILNGSLSVLSNSGSPGSENYKMRINNVQHFVSTALTNAAECKDSLANTYIGNARNVLKKEVKYVSVLTSNALAICNKLAPNYD